VSSSVGDQPTECLRSEGLVKSFRGRKVVKGVAIEACPG